ncbi:SRPBCC domain-containing protein [Nocardia carnea]|uniref:SRPBCC domain-containing protein n=1 Tax=Nocardia carnea TaxID=37328 RepID=UPI002458B3EF|nr:SRPBCC domain-containing protein [Nocardia carnea]
MMPVVEIDTWIDIAAPPEKVWHILSDFSSYSEWNPFFVDALGQARPGRELILYTRFSARFDPRPFTVIVREADAPHRLHWGGRLGIAHLADGRHGFDLTPLPDGTRMRHHSRHHGLAIPLVRPLMLRLKPRYHDLNEALRQRAEDH